MPDSTNDEVRDDKELGKPEAKPCYEPPEVIKLTDLTVGKGGTPAACNSGGLFVGTQRR